MTQICPQIGALLPAAAARRPDGESAEGARRGNNKGVWDKTLGPVKGIYFPRRQRGGSITVPHPTQRLAARAALGVRRESLWPSSLSCGGDTIKTLTDPSEDVKVCLFHCLTSS